MKEKGRIKILGLIDHGGSKFHRVSLPLKALNGKEVMVGGEKCIIEVSIFDKGIDQYFSEEEIKNNDIVYSNWAMQNNEGAFSVSLNKYNTLYIADFDDFWVYPNNPVTKHTEDVGKILRQIVQADFVIASTLRLAEHCKQYNPFVIVNENSLPVGEGQFLETKKKRGELLNVGICGSISHLVDWMQLKGVINRLAKNKNIAKNCKFVICGYKKVGEYSYWDEVVKMFKIKKNLNVEIIDGLEVGEYMKLYENLDVCLMPLVDHEFNYTKSPLKLRECAIKGVVPIGSKIYSEKDGVGILKSETGLQYEGWLEYLLKEGNLEKMSERMSNLNLKTNDFEGRIETLRQVVEFVHTEEFQKEKKKTPKNLKIFSICYDDEQICEYERYDNSHIKTVEQDSFLFEYNPVKDILLNKVEDIDNESYIAIMSHKFPFKSGISSKILHKIFGEVVVENPDFINLSPDYWKFGKEYMDFSAKQHPQLMEILGLCMKNLGKEYKTPSEVNYSNFFCLKKKWYLEYLNEWILPTIKYLKEGIPELAMGDSTYKSGLSPEKLKEYTGISYYTNHSFVLERMILQFIDFKKSQLGFSSDINKQFKVMNIL